MHTRFFLLLVLSLLLSTTTSSVVVNKYRSAAAIGNEAPAEHMVPSGSPVNTYPVQPPREGSQAHHEETSPLPPEDGKHHHFHFTRIEALKRRRKLNRLLCQVVLMIGHICCFIYCFMHVFH